MLTDDRLSAVADELEKTGWAAELADSAWRLRWMSTELMTILGEHDPDRLGFGMHSAAARYSPGLCDRLTGDSVREWLRHNVPRMAPFTPGGLPAILDDLPPDVAAELRALPPVVATQWTGENLYTQRGLPPARTRYLVCALHDEAGELFGWLTIFGGGVPASLLSLVARGSRAMFARMAALLEPGRHETAIVFADIQASSQLARRVASARFFEIIRTFCTDADAAVIRHRGIVGRHAGDGVTAFFLAEQTGGRAEACSAALRTAHELVAWSPPAELLPPGDGMELHVNAAVHWGGALYLGQVVTGGRLEITALGDEVNECARMQQTARNGTLLASKALVERLDPEDAAHAGLDPMRITYRTVAQLPGVDHKAVRDAGGVPVVALTPRLSGGGEERLLGRDEVAPTYQ